ncbi:MAG: glycosyltransferase family 2 protein [Alphaproteobacteria bacterium]
MTSTPKVTIVTAVYNLIKAGRKDTFLQALASIKSQNYENLEHIVIDGASTDGTIEFLDSLGVKYYLQPDTGIYDAFNKGIEKASGDYIAFLNSDDFYHDSKFISSSMSVLLASNADCVHSNHIVAKENSKSYLAKPKVIKLLQKMPVNHPTTIVKKDVLKKLGGFDCRYKIAGDADLFLRFFLTAHKAVYLNKTMVTFREGGVSTTNLSTLKKEWANIYKKNFSNIYPISEKEIDTLNKQKIFPLRLLINILKGKYQFAVKKAALISLLKNIKHTIKRKK